MSVVWLVTLCVTAAVGCLALALVTPRMTRLRGLWQHGLSRLARGGDVARAPELPSLRRGANPLQLLSLMRPEGEGGWAGVSGKTLLVWGAIAVPVGLLLRMVFSLPILMSMPAAMAGVALVSYGLRRRRRIKRRNEIANAMPEALESLLRALRVGLPVAAALRAAGDKMPGALGEELRLTSERISFGQDIGEALYALADRTGNTDLRFLAASVAIQMVTGGNLAELLERLVSITRARHQLQRKVDSITAEARWSGRFLSAFPVVAIGGVWLVDGNYFDSLIASDAFATVCGVVGALLILNVLFMRWLSNLD